MENQSYYIAMIISSLYSRFLVSASCNPESENIISNRAIEISHKSIDILRNVPDLDCLTYSSSGLQPLACSRARMRDINAKVTASF